MPILSPHNPAVVSMWLKKPGNEFSHVKEYLRFFTVKENLKYPEVLELKCERNSIVCFYLFLNREEHLGGSFG